MKQLEVKQIHVATAIRLEHESINSASMLTKGNLVIGVILGLRWHSQKDYPSKHHLGQGKDEHELYMQMTEGYIKGTTTMNVRVTTKGLEVIVHIHMNMNYMLYVCYINR